MAKHHLVLIIAQRGGIPSRANFSFSKTATLCTVLRPRSVQHALFLVQILFQEIVFNKSRRWTPRPPSSSGRAVTKVISGVMLGWARLDLKTKGFCVLSIALYSI